MSDASWYQRKLSQMRQSSPRPAANWNGDGRNTQGGVAGMNQVTFQQPQTANPAQIRYLQPQPQPDKVTIENLYEAAGYWRGGEAARTNPNQCPRCGGNQYFDNVKASKRGPAPAPHCYNCGYNDGMFDQGQASTWGAT